jgi:hypothetical protein
VGDRLTGTPVPSRGPVDLVGGAARIATAVDAATSAA